MKWYEALHERGTVVYVDEDRGYLAIWNGSLTINWYDVTPDGEFFATDCNTLEGDDRGKATLDEAIQGAREIAEYWLHQYES